MGTEGRNFSGDVAYLRDTFLGYEKEYLNELLTDPSNLKKIDRFKRAPLREVVKYAKRLIGSMELGVHTYPDGKQEVIGDELSAKLEKEICLALYSIEDAVLVKTLEKTMDDDLGMER